MQYYYVCNTATHILRRVPFVSRIEIFTVYEPKKSKIKRIKHKSEPLLSQSIYIYLYISKICPNNSEPSTLIKPQENIIIDFHRKQL